MITPVEPHGWWLAASLIAFLLVLVRRLRRRSRQVTTLFLLRRILHRSHFNDRRLRLLRRLAYLLLVLAAAGTAGASLRPLFSDRPPRLEIAVVDLSPSMGVLEGEESRISVLLKRLRDLADGMGEGDRLVVVTAGRRPRVLADLRDGRPAGRDLAPLRPDDAPADLAAAARLAAGLAAGERPVVRIFTDRPARWNVPEVEPLLARLKPAFESAGSPAPNAGIIAFDLRREPLSPGLWDLFVKVRNEMAGGQPPGGGFTLKVANNAREVKTVPLILGEGEEREVVLKDVALSPGSVEVHVDPGGGYRGDDTVRAGIPGRTTLRVVAVTPRGSFLEKALLAHPAVEARLVRPGEPFKPDVRAINVFDGRIPDGPLPERALFIAPDRPPEGIVFRSMLAGTGLVTWDRAEPVLRGIDFEGTSFRSAYAFEITPAFREVASADGFPMVMLGTDPRRRWAVLSFDPAETTMVFHPSFPILVANLLEWLSALASGERLHHPVGEAIGLLPEAGGGRVDLPGGERKVLPENPGGGVVFDDTGRAGTYRVRTPAGRELGSFFVNVLDPGVTAEAAAADVGGGGGGPAPPPGGHRLGLGPWLALLGLFLLAAEAWLSGRLQPERS